ncbi:MAG: hypothetical protein Alpg2KO_31680 [Alphaproteobacteria bacterium]
MLIRPTFSDAMMAQRSALKAVFRHELRGVVTGRKGRGVLVSLIEPFFWLGFMGAVIWIAYGAVQIEMVQMMCLPVLAFSSFRSVLMAVTGHGGGSALARMPGILPLDILSVRGLLACAWSFCGAMLLAVVAYLVTGQGWVEISDLAVVLTSGTAALGVGLGVRSLMRLWRFAWMISVLMLPVVAIGVFTLMADSVEAALLAMGAMLALCLGLIAERLTRPFAGGQSI